MAKALDFVREPLDLDVVHLPSAPELSIRELCHDLRQPIATIAALAEASRINPDLPEEVSQHLSHILKETAQMSELVTHLLSGRVAPVPVDAAKVAAEAVASAQVTYDGMLQVVAEPTTVVCDELALRRVLANLVENAMRAAGPGGTVVVTVKSMGRWVRFDVADTGPGFGAGPRGTGSYGLAIVDRFMRAHGGRIEIRRSHLGGALVRLRLPARA